MIVEDHEGLLWEVAKGDPAYPIVGKLTRRGFSRIALPQETIRSGSNDSLLPDTAALARAYRRLEDQGAGKEVLGPLGEAFLRACIVRECCLEAAEGGTL